MITSKALAHSHPCRNLCRLCAGLVGVHTAHVHGHSYMVQALRRKQRHEVAGGRNDRLQVDNVHEVEDNRPLEDDRREVDRNDRHVGHRSNRRVEEVDYDDGSHRDEVSNHVVDRGGRSSRRLLVVDRSRDHRGSRPVIEIDSVHEDAEFRIEAGTG